MTYENLLLWLSFMVPLLFSPGPANLTISSYSGSFGLKKTLNFISGILLWNLIAGLFIGLSFGTLHQKSEKIFHYIELLGCFYIFYLAWTFYQNSLKQKNDPQSSASLKKPSFRSGLFMQIVNGKLYPVLSLMYSQFLDCHQQVYTEMITLTLMFTGLCACTYLLYGSAGAKINKTLGDKGKARQMQISAILLALVGVWLLGNSILFQ